MIRSMIEDFIRPIKGGKAHEIRIRIDNPAEQAIVGKKNLTRYLPSGGDRDKAVKLAQAYIGDMIAAKRRAEAAARGETTWTEYRYGSEGITERGFTGEAPAGAFTFKLPNSQAVYLNARDTRKRREPVTIAQVIELWKAERTQAGDAPKDKAINAYTSTLNLLFLHLGKPDDFRGITRPDLLDYRRDLITGNVQNSRGKPPHPRSTLETIRSMFTIAATNNLIPENPTKDLPMPTSSGKTRQPFTMEERAIILGAAKKAEPAIRWAHWLAAFTAAIQSELRVLTPSNLYQENGFTVLHIRPPEGSKLKTEYRPRMLPLHSAVIAEGFMDYVEQVRREEGDNAPLFPMGEAKFERETNRLIKDAGIDKTFYSHRHFIATELEGFHITDEKGRRIDVSRYVAGHAALDVHEKHYVHRSLDQLSKAIETLPGA